MNKFFTFFYILISSFIYSQDLEIYNKVYYKTFVETSQKDFNHALSIADSLYTISHTPLFQTRSLMLSASLYQQSGDLKRAIEYALDSEKIISQTDNYSWITRVNGFLATQYRLLNLYSYSKKYASVAIEAAQKIVDPVAANSAMGLMYQEMAYSEEANKNYKKSIEYCLKSNELFSGITANKNTLLADNYYLLGRNYFRLQDMDKAKSFYEKAIELVENTNNSYLLGKIYSSLANVYINKEELKKAKDYLSKAEKISENSNYLELKRLIYFTSQSYYMAVKSMDSLRLATTKRDSVLEKIQAKKTSVINATYDELENKKVVLEKQTSRNTYLFAFLFLAFIATVIITYIFYKKHQRKNLARFRVILRELQNTEIANKETPEIEILNPVQEEIIVEKDFVNESIMPVETEKRIVESLKDFEKSTLYLNNNMALSSLATHLETNTKYLSYVINLHKKKDFNNYINDLRINYIVRKLRDEPIYRKYKIATIAEEAGFSSPNKFALIFKKSMDLTPSAYIKLLEQENITP